MVYEGKYYGTLKSELERIWAKNKVPVLDIDVKGAIHVQQQYPENTLSIFVEPPSVDELKKDCKAAEQKPRNHWQRESIKLLMKYLSRTSLIR